MSRHLVIPALALCAALLTPSAKAQEKVLNLYSARHYQTDEALYQDFTKATGIRINRVDSDDAGILARLLLSAGTAGNLTTDAHIAAIAIEHQAEVLTFDKDFARFSGLRYQLLS